MTDPASTVRTQDEYTGVENLEVMREALRYNAFLADLVRNALPASGTIVDFGAGTGTFARALAACGRARSASSSTTDCVSVSRGTDSLHTPT